MKPCNGGKHLKTKAFGETYMVVNDALSLLLPMEHVVGMEDMEDVPIASESMREAAGHTNGHHQRPTTRVTRNGHTYSAARGCLPTPHWTVMVT